MAKVLAAGQRRTGQALLTMRVVAVVGLIGPALFVSMIILLDILHFDFLTQLGFSPLTTNPLSAHQRGPFGALAYLTFFLSGLCVLVFGWSLRRFLRHSRTATMGSRLIAAAGLGIVLWTWPFDAGSPSTWHGFLHFAGIPFFIFGTFLAAIVLFWALRRDDRWRGYEWASLAVAVAIVAAVVFARAFETHTNWFGLGGKLHYGLAFGWLEALALRLLLISRGSSDH